MKRVSLVSTTLVLKQIILFIYWINTQEKKLKNWYIQEHTTGTTFEPKFKKKRYEDEYRQW